MAKNREILFRGKARKADVWFEGNLIRINNGECERVWIKSIDSKTIEGAEVDPKTVGQYTGRKDKNGRKIFDGDIIKLSWVDSDGDSGQEIFVSVYSEEHAAFVRRVLLNGEFLRDEMLSQEELNDDNAEIIGNIFDDAWNGVGGRNDSNEFIAE